MDLRPLKTPIYVTHEKAIIMYSTDQKMMDAIYMYLTVHVPSMTTAECSIFFLVENNAYTSTTYIL